MSRSRRPTPPLSLLAAGLAALAGCSEAGSGEDPGEPPGLPERVAIPDPDPRVTRLTLVEDLSEEVADRMLAFSDKLRRRDFASAESWLTRDFHGHGLVDLEVSETRDEHLDVSQVVYDLTTAAVVTRADFLAGLRSLIGPWSAVDSVIWKVKGAEFQKGRGSGWGTIKLFIHMTGTGAGRSGVALSAWGRARVEREQGQWCLARFALDSLTIASRAGPVFSNVTSAAGVAHVGQRFGQPANHSFAWNGAACGDVDGDGRWDLFVPSDGRNFLYLGTDQGRFAEQAEVRGVAQPDGGTGAVLFDFDNDGDQDLAVGHAPDGIGGERIQLYVNDGSGRFERVEGALGMGALPVVAYSLTVLDYDADGWLDLYVCGYGIVERQHNNSWIEATNGAPNALFRNIAGPDAGERRFVDVAAEAGVRGTSWSYASSAADFDGDGDTDLYVANDYGTNRLYRNEGDGTFVDVAVELGVADLGNGMGCAFGDLTADGRLDLYVSNMSSTAGNRILDRYEGDIDPELWAVLKKSAAGNTIFRSTEGGGFERLPRKAGGVGASWAWAPALADFDLDGRLDVFCTNGFVTGDLPFDT